MKIIDADFWCGLRRVMGFFVVVCLIVPIIVLLPNESARRYLAHLTARLAIRLAGYSFQVIGIETLPPGPCIAVANHASYLDGILLTAALPARFAFVIKDGMASTPLVSLLLRRLGSAFVNRDNAHSGSRDTRRIFKQAQDGHSMMFFPEGTIHRQPGLHEFKLGAFLIAARLNLPVVPITLQGVRLALPDGSWWPKAAQLTVQIHPFVSPTGSKRVDAGLLHDAARQAVLTCLNEPDLEEKPS
jgi:1-acyl-sn-glycerol-3-phosphate acyltransferase